MSQATAVVLESTVAEDCPAEERRELRAGSEEIAQALESLGYRAEIVAFDLDTASVRARLSKLGPDIVFNLVDSIEGKGDLISLAPMLLAHMGLTYTGADALATAISCDKIASKRILRSERIACCGWLSEAEIETGEEALSGLYILKSITEHASFGIYADSVVEGRPELQRRLAEKRARHGGRWFAERYIEGREFNLSVLAGEGGPQVLPPAEILFTADFPAGKPRIVDYVAKWHEASPESIGTVRRFDFPESDAPLLAELSRTALQCWHAFGLSGYARVDYRVDAQGRAYVLEVNCNPFLTAAEGFGAAAARGGLSFAQAVRAILADAYRTGGRQVPGRLAA